MWFYPICRPVVCFRKRVVRTLSSDSSDTEINTSRSRHAKAISKSSSKAKPSTHATLPVPPRTQLPVPPPPHTKLPFPPQLPSVLPVPRSLPASTFTTTLPQVVFHSKSSLTSAPDGLSDISITMSEHQDSSVSTTPLPHVLDTVLCSTPSAPMSSTAQRSSSGMGETVSNRRILQQTETSTGWSSFHL